MAELAKRIEELRAANTVETMPERTGERKAAKGEQPVTTRIRAMVPEQPAETAEEPAPAPVEEKPQPVDQPQPVAEVIPMPEPARTVEGYRKRVAETRYRKPEQLRLF